MVRRILPLFLLFFLSLHTAIFAADPQPSPAPPAAASVPAAPAQPQAPRFKVQVDCAQKLGDASGITDFFGSGGSLYYITNNVDDPVAQSWRDLGFNQVTFETMHMEDPMDRWVKVSVDEKGEVQVDFSEYDRYFRQYLENLGAKPFVYLGNVPRALSSKPDDPDFAVYPPKNLKLWRSFVKKIVQHNVEKFRLKGLNYGVIGEPDHHESWRGTLKEHIELYAATYQAVKAADKFAKVGGPAAMSWRKTANTQGAAFFLKDWIKALAAHNQEDPDQAVGLDFVSWQDYGWTGKKISEGAEAVSGYLKDNGFDPATPKMLAGSGWGSWSSDYLDTKQSPWQRASFVLGNLIDEFRDPSKRNFQQALYYSFYFNDYWLTPETEKDLQMQRSVAMVIIPKQGRFQLTPVYAAFQMAKNMSTGQAVETGGQKPLESMAVVDEAGERVVVTVTNPTSELSVADFSVKNIPLDLSVVKARLQSIDEFHSVDGYGLEEGFEIEPKITGKDAEISIFIKPYGTLQMTWRKPDPPKEEDKPKEEEAADDDINPRVPI